MTLSIWKAADQTIGATLSTFFYFRSDRKVRIVVAKCDNSTRPENDPRPAFMAIGPREDDVGLRSCLVKMGYTNTYGDLVWEPKKEVILEGAQQLLMKVLGENGDTAGARVLYEHVDEDRRRRSLW